MRFFQRLNFFTGLFTTADDWRREQAYHLHKHRLHNRGFHTPGVVLGEGENLAVTVTDEGKVLVLPGYAIDGRGRDLYLAEPIALDLPSGAEKSVAQEAAQRYVAISFAEKHRDPRTDNLNPQYSGDAFIEERPTLEWTSEPPNNQDQVELARATWKIGQRLTKDQIDTSHVCYAGADRPAALVKAAEIDLNPSEGGSKSVGDEVRVLIKSHGQPQGARGVVYMANVFPIDATSPRDSDPHIISRIESTLTQAKEVAYHLVMVNVGKSKVRVRFEVYRLNVGPVS